MSKCPICKDQVAAGHLCFMQKIEDDSPDTSLLFYDMETTQEMVLCETANGKVYQHIVNLVCSKKVWFIVVSLNIHNIQQN